MHLEDTDRTVRLIEKLDLEPIAFKLVHPELGETSMTVEEVDELIEKYRRFLKLRAMYPEKSIVPTKEIDEVWHAHILDTVKYADDCEVCFGYFLHHFPYFGMRGEADAVRLAEAGAETRELYKQHFNEDMSDGTEAGVEGECNCTGSCSPSSVS